MEDIVFIGNVGLSGALRLAAENPEKMKERFPEHILMSFRTNVRNPMTLSGSLICEEIPRCARNDSSGCVPDCTRGALYGTKVQEELFDIIQEYAGEGAHILAVGSKGVSAALWELGEDIRSGFKIYADRIPVSQMTVEICELFGEDPYKCESDGCFLVCTEMGNELCYRMREDGAEAVIIGHTVAENGKMMVMGEITRYLDKPR